MTLQVVLPPERNPAQATTKRLLPRMHHHVHLKRAEPPELVITNITLELPNFPVDQSMLAQVAGRLEKPPAIHITALERPFGRMRPNMNRQIPALIRPVPAIRTNELLEVVVNEFMSVQAARRLEALPASRANVRLLVPVHPDHMQPQGPFTPQNFPAPLAGITILIMVLDVRVV